MVRREHRRIIVVMMTGGGFIGIPGTYQAPPPGEIKTSLAIGCVRINRYHARVAHTRGFDPNMAFARVL